MTVSQTPHSSRRQGRQRPQRAGARRPLGPAAALLALVVCVGLTGLLQSDELMRLGEGLPPGATRDFTLACARPLQAAASFLGFNRPAAAVERLRSSSGLRQSTTTATLTPAVGHTTLPPGGAATPTTGRSSTTAGSPTTTTTMAPTTTTTEPPPVYSPAHPLRVWVGGDSMVEQVGDSLRNMAASLEYLDVRMTFKINSGLCRPDYFDWPQTMRDVVADFEPHVAVLMFGGNDMQGIVENGVALRAFTPEWNDAYGRRVAQSLEVFTSTGARVIWLGTPIMRDEKDDAWSRDLNAIYQEVCSRYSEQVDYVDCRALFSDADGAYSAYLQDGQGKTWHVREPDGIHFTLAGGDWVATEILRLMRSHFTLTTQ